MSSPSSSVATAPVRPGRALLVAVDPLRTLAALGDTFADLQQARLEDVRDDLEAAVGDVVVVVDGPVPAEVTVAVTDHLLSHSGQLLALGVPEASASLGGVEYAGLRIVGSGRLADLPVTWWVAADAGAVDPATLPTGSATRAAGSARGGEPDSFAAQAQVLRAGLERAQSHRAAAPAPEAVEAPPSPSEVDPAEIVAPPAPAAPRARRRRHRRVVAAGLVGVGIVGGVGLAQLGSDPVGALTLVALAVILLVLLWCVVAVRRLARRVQEQTDRTRRLGKDLDRGLRQLARRSQVTDSRGLRMRDRLRETEARLAIISSAAFNGATRRVPPGSAASELDDSAS